MQEIVKDKGGIWYYNDEKGRYICLDANGDKLATIKPEYIPDPLIIWDNKCKSANVTKESNEGVLLRPSNVVYKLWEHKYANFDN